MTFFTRLLTLIALPLLTSWAVAQEAPRYPTVRLTDLPDAVHKLYKREEPNFTNMSHCAAAWDSATDGDRIAFKCSVFIKMSAEGERRAMHYCEEIRADKKISSPCRLIVRN